MKTKSYFFLVFVSIFFECSQTKEHDKESNQIPQLINTVDEQDSAEEISHLNINNKPSLIELPTELHEAIQQFSFHSLKNILFGEYGAMLIQSGPGVYPVMQKIVSANDLLDLNEWVLFSSDSSALVSMVTYSCEWNKLDWPNDLPPGIYVTKEKLPELNFQEHQKPNKSTQQSWEFWSKQSDINNTWHIHFTFLNKQSETIFLDTYFMKLHHTYYLAVIDQRDGSA